MDGWMDMTAASRTGIYGGEKRVGRGRGRDLNCLFEILRVFRILKRIPANQHHVEGHAA